MGVRAKFMCKSIEAGSDGTRSIRLEPVTEGSEENKLFYKWTPSGSIVLGCINKAAWSQFQPGEEYYVDFTPAMTEIAEPAPNEPITAESANQS